MTSFWLKLSAIALMTCDHVGALFFADEPVFRLIGRLAFPIFAFCIAEGYRKTKNANKYLFRLVAFAFISEVPFDLCFLGSAFDLGYQNVFFTLAAGLLAVMLYDRFTKERNLTAGVLCVGLMCFAAIILRSDYMFIGVLMVFIFFVCKTRRQITIWMAAVVTAHVFLQLFNSSSLMWALFQYAELAALPIIFAYNGKPGYNLKYLLYTYYPAHLLLLYAIYRVYRQSFLI